MTTSAWILVIVLIVGFDNKSLVIPFPDKASCETAATVLGSQLGIDYTNSCRKLGEK